MLLNGLADSGKFISGLLIRNELDGDMGAVSAGVNSDGDAQKALDILANDAVLEACRKSSVRAFASEEEDTVLELNPEGEYSIAVDPLDGSSNIDNNFAVGTIFSVYPNAGGSIEGEILRRGSEQVAAGYIIYGSQTVLLLTLGKGTARFILDQNIGDYVMISGEVKIPGSGSEFAINASNRRFWSPSVRTFIESCELGIEGPMNRNFNMRWIASMVADNYRILRRGGVFMYPADSRKGYTKGRLRLIYEANPIAMLVENAGGLVSTGKERILDLMPEELHQRCPLVFGSPTEVNLYLKYIEEEGSTNLTSPLFRKRGLYSDNR